MNHRPHKLAQERLFNHGLSLQRFEKPGHVVAWLGAIQAQDYEGAKWSIGLRLPDAGGAEVEQELAEHKIVRTWAMRGTLQFLATLDAHWILRLLAPRIIDTNKRRYRQLELDETTLEKASQLLVEALDQGRQLDRLQLREGLERAGMSAQGQRLYYMLQYAGLSGRICLGEQRKNQPLFRRLEPAPGHAPAFTREEALAELARRYFASHGPATLADLAWWSGLLMADVRAGVEGASFDLEPETRDGDTYWRAAGAPDGPAGVAAHLLPGFDEYVVGYRERGAIIDAERKDALSGGGGMLSPSILLQGRIAGTWKRAFRKDAVIVSLRLFGRPSRAERRDIETAGQRYGRFLRKPITFDYT